MRAERSGLPLLKKGPKPWLQPNDVVVDRISFQELFGIGSSFRH